MKYLEQNHAVWIDSKNPKCIKKIGIINFLCDNVDTDKYYHRYADVKIHPPFKNGHCIYKQIRIDRLELV